MTAQPTPPHWNAPPLLAPADCVAQARDYYDKGWSVYCCTAYVGMSNRPDEYVEPHWIIEAIENHGWRLAQLDYLCIELDRTADLMGTSTLAKCRIEAKLMFRRRPTPNTGGETYDEPETPEGADQ